MSTITWDIKTVTAVFGMVAILSGAFLFRERALWVQSERIQAMEWRIQTLETNFRYHEINHK